MRLLGVNVVDENRAACGMRPTPAAAREMADLPALRWTASSRVCACRVDRPSAERTPAGVMAPCCSEFCILRGGGGRVPGRCDAPRRSQFFSTSLQCQGLIIVTGWRYSTREQMHTWRRWRGAAGGSVFRIQVACFRGLGTCRSGEGLVAGFYLRLLQIGTAA
jgi:hypothetical protein